jgi:hypothetical protein
LLSLDIQQLPFFKPTISEYTLVKLDAKFFVVLTFFRLDKCLKDCYHFFLVKFLELLDFVSAVGVKLFLLLFKLSQYLSYVGESLLFRFWSWVFAMVFVVVNEVPGVEVVVSDAVVVAC